MLTLMLLRHAKAVQQSRGDDFLRDLQDKGRGDVMRLGVYLAAHRLVPDLALVSTSARTRQTFEGLTAALGAPVSATFDETLYNATAAELRGFLRTVDPTVRTLMIIGHNPGIADIAVMLARDSDHVDIARMRNRFSPCGLAVIACDTDDWADAAARGGRLDLFLLPDDLAD